MFYLRLFFPLLFTISGCAYPPQGAGYASSWPFVNFASAGDRAVTSIDAQGGASGIRASEYRSFSFDWQVSGNAEVLPLQVFDDGVKTWLQFARDSAWPAVFEVAQQGWRPLAYRQEAEYMVIHGVYPELALRGGHLHGIVRRVSSETPRVAEPSQAALASPTVPSASPTGPTPKAPLSAVAASSVPGTGVTPLDESPVRVTNTESDSAVSLPVSADYLGSPVHRYAVSPADGTIRQALERWAGLSGWDFSAEHWAVDVDIPLVGQAQFDTDFKSAVRELLGATEMGERPLQPCFYSNRVLRVVPYAEPCDRRNGGIAS